MLIITLPWLMRSSTSFGSWGKETMSKYFELAKGLDQLLDKEKSDLLEHLLQLLFKSLGRHS
jgi:hypothetical protein